MQRVQQKARTREAVLAAARELVAADRPVTVTAVARAAGMSEATVYRYFSGAPELRRAALDRWPPPEELLRDVLDEPDPATRVAHAATVLLERIAEREAVTRALVADALTSDDPRAKRPNQRLALLDLALTVVPDDHPALPALRLRLAAVVGAEAYLACRDVSGLDPAEAVATLVALARDVTAVTLGRRPRGPARAHRRR